MNAVKQRLIELAIIGRQRKLTATEAREWEESRQYLINHAWRVARIMNLMYAARVAKDWQWFGEIAGDYIDFVSGRR